MFLHVTKASYISDFQLWLEFNDGTKGKIDLSNKLSGEIFEPLKDLDIFKNFVLDPDLNTVVWSNGADFAPEYLQSLVQEEKAIV